MVKMFKREYARATRSLFSRDNGCCCDPTKRRYSMWGDVRWPFSVLRTKQDAVFYNPQHTNTGYNLRIGGIHCRPYSKKLCCALRVRLHGVIELSVGFMMWWP